MVPAGNRVEIQMYDLDDIKDRLAKFAARCEQEGSYTNQTICNQALGLIERMEEALEEAVNYADHGLNVGHAEFQAHRATMRAQALKALNWGHETNERGERA